MQQTSGEIIVMGAPPRDNRLHIGYLTQQFSLYPDLSIEENMRYSAGLRQVPDKDFQERKEKSLKQMDLARFRDRLAGQLSGGMKQKLALCCALISRPDVLLLDEPTTGVDPVSRREFWDLLADVSADGVTIAVATPYLDEAERCNRVALMYGGQIHQLGTVQELKANLKLHRLELRSNKMLQVERELVSSLLQSGDAISDVQTFGDRLDVLVPDLERGEEQVKGVSARLHLNDLEIKREEPTLENVFVTSLRRDKAARQSSQEGEQGLVEAFEFEKTHYNVKGDPAIKAENVSKVFGDFVAVDKVNLDVAYGQIYGLLGANGAGKTTTIKMLCGLIIPSEGVMMLSGKTSDLRNPKLRERLGYMSQKFTLYDDLSVLENLEFYCGVYQVPRRSRASKIRWVLQAAELVGQEKMLTSKLPGGWKQRLAFGACVMHEPEILFLDEPTSGVDPLARRQLWVMIAELARQGTAVLVTTHFLEEAEHCHKLGFMAAGKLVAQGSPSEIKASQPGKLMEIVTSRNQAASNLLKTQIDGWRVSIFADRLHIVLDNPGRELAAIEQTLQQNGITVKSVRDVPFSLEDSFIGIVQRAMDDS